MKHLPSTIMVLAILACGEPSAKPPGMMATSTTSAPLRRVISLDGTWQIAEGGRNVVPAKFEHQVPVPGLVDMATPPFVEPGPRVHNREQLRQKDPRRDAFWYRRTFQLSGPFPAVARLKIGKAMFGTRVFLNGKLLGDHAPCYTPGFFEAGAALKEGTNELIVRIGADRDAVFGRAESGHDGEKQRYIPGIFDSVELILSGTPHILNLQAVPDIEKQAVTVQVWLRYTGTPSSEKLRFTIREASTGQLAGEAESEIPAPTDGNQQKMFATIPIRHCQLWSPEHPFLYELKVQGSADDFSTRFGMRTFRLDPTTGHAVLNGHPYFLRGTNVTFYRFLEDPLRGDKPWREEWVRRLDKSFRDMHWNAMRYSIGPAPEFWYRIADEEGILIQDEFPIWHDTDETAATIDGNELAAEFREWMEERWNHPSVVIWDACNETRSSETGRAIRQVRGLDYSNRPWDNGWGVPDDPGDSDEVHPYHFIFGPDQPFRMYKIARDPGTKAGLLIAQPYAEEKLLRKNPLIINEYGGLWLNRDGTPTTLSRPVYDYLLEPRATVAERRRVYAQDMAALTEFFRVHRQAAGVLQFSALTYSRPDGQTSDDWTDLEKLTRDPDFYHYVRDSFAPVGLMVDSWAEEYPAGATQNFPVLLVNDLDEDWKGDVRFRLLQDGKVLQEKIEPSEIASFGTAKVAFALSIPQAPGTYQVEATLLDTPFGAVHSFREFRVLTADQRETRRNLVLGRQATASSERGPEWRAAFAVDDNGETQWAPALGGGPQWLAVDLGETESVSRVELVWGGTVKSYAIEVSSNGVIWKTVRAAERGHRRLDIVRFPPTPARWVRVSIHECTSESECSLELGIYH
ncbi:MAG: discoidin domain-containing protein [Candidatus Sulfotelmatobacter sp.]